MNPFSNPFYFFQPLVVVVASIVLLGVVLYGSRRNFSSWLFCGFLLTVCLWGVLVFGMRSSPDIYRALLWERGLPTVSFATFVLYYHFTLAYTNTRPKRGILPASYLFLVVIAIISPTDLIIEEMRLEYYGYAPVVGPIVFALALGSLLLMGGGAYNLLRRYISSLLYEERNRILYLLIAVPFLLLGAFSDAFSNLPPVAIWGNLIFCIICSVAILRYHLLDIRIVIRKSLAYIVVSLVIATPYVGILYLLHLIFKPILEPWWVHPIIILLLAIILRPLYSRAQQLVDRIFYRDRYEHLRALEQFSQKAQSVVNLKELSSTLTQLVGGALRTSSACLLLPSESDKGLIVASSSGLGSPPSGVVLRNRSLLIKWLKLRQRIISSEEFNIVPQLQSLSLRDKNNLEQMGARLYVPIQTSPAQLSGILVLGQKLSQQTYSSEDRQLLTALSSQMAIALENARLYNESQQEVRERKQTEEALRESESFLKAVFNSIHTGILIIDSETHQIVDANPIAIKMIGVPKRQIIGRVCHGYVCPSEKGHCPITDLGKILDKSERVLLKANGEKVPIFKTVAPAMIGDRKLLFESFIDITERKQAEEREKELQQELYLSSRLASIGELAAGVAHEINNPLTGIVGFSQRLLRKSTDEEASQDLEIMRRDLLSQDLQIIHNEAQRAAKVVENLLTFARRRQPKKQYSDVNEILQSALELRAYELKTSNIEVITHLAPSLPQIMVDFHQIQEVFLNIILNAEQVMTEARGGKRLTIETEEKKGYIRTTFTDNGPGIPAEHLVKIFDPFFTTRGERGGTGLGLSACHGIVTEHGGKLYAKSKPGKGATFFVDLPISTEMMAKG